MIFLLCNNLFIYQVLCTLIYRWRSLYSFLLDLSWSQCSTIQNYETTRGVITHWNHLVMSHMWIYLWEPGSQIIALKSCNYMWYCPVTHSRHATMHMYANIRIHANANTDNHIHVCACWCVNIYCRLHPYDSRGGWFNALQSKQNGGYFADDNFENIFVNENVRIANKLKVKYLPDGHIRISVCMHVETRQWATMVTLLANVHDDISPLISNTILPKMFYLVCTIVKNYLRTIQFEIYLCFCPKQIVRVQITIQILVI